MLKAVLDGLMGNMMQWKVFLPMLVGLKLGDLSVTFRSKLFHDLTTL